MAQCKPTASVKDIKKAIFESADEDTLNLKEKIIGGKILNIEKAIELMCERPLYPNSEQPESTQEDMFVKEEL